MKKFVLIICVSMLYGILIPSFASQRIVSQTRIASKSTISGTNIPYIQPHRCRPHHHNGVQINGSPRHKYVTQRFNGYENSNFSRRSYYIPTYCQPGAAMYNGMHNPFCNQYLPYGSGAYINF